MSFFFSHSLETNDDLIAFLERHNHTKEKSIAKAMRNVDRKDFVPSNCDPYDDSPQPLGYGATISAPHMHAYALSFLVEKLKPNCKALDIGCGSGIICAYLAQFIGDEGKVIGIDHIKELCDLAINNLKK